MHCPSCRSEYRAGVHVCPTCDVALVDSLDDSEGAPARAHEPSLETVLHHAVVLAGFLSLDDARAARRTLRDHGIASDILIRETEDRSAAEGEEYWIRVSTQDLQAAAPLLGEEPEVEPAHEDHGTLCSACNGPVSEDAVECPHCGARFE